MPIIVAPYGGQYVPLLHCIHAYLTQSFAPVHMGSSCYLTVSPSCPNNLGSLLIGQRTPMWEISSAVRS